MNTLKGLTAFSFLLLLISGVTAQNIEDFVTIDEEDEIDFNSTVFTFDNSTRLVEYEYNTENGTRFLFYSDIPRTVEIYDVNGLRQSGVNGLPIQQYRLNSGYTEVLTTTTSLRGDLTSFIIVGESYATVSNSRTADLIGTPDSTLGFVLGITGGGVAVIFLIIASIKYKQRKIDKNGVRRR